MATKRKRTRKNSRQLALRVERPRILVLEGLSGGSEAIRAAGGMAVRANPRSLKDATLDLIESREWDGLLLTGGGDVDPRLYGSKKPHREVYGVNETRDETELLALEFAHERGLPVLGICRGAQIMNVEAGGTLRQHIRGHRGGKHLLLTEEGSLLRKVCPQHNKRVVTLHHQEIKDLGEDYVATGYAPDGTVEAIESQDERCIGVQFHPEMEADALYARCLFRWLVVEAAKRANMPVPPLPKPKPKRPLSVSEFQQRRADKHKPVARNYAKTKAGPLTVSWFCPHGCTIGGRPLMFDHIKDRDDHVALLHGRDQVRS